MDMDMTVQPLEMLRVLLLVWMEILLYWICQEKYLF